MSDEDHRKSNGGERAAGESRELVEALYARHANELQRFLFGLAREDSVAADLLQATFLKAIEQAHTVQPEAMKSWLFQVAYREWAAGGRKARVHDRAKAKIAILDATEETAADRMQRKEEAAKVRQAIAQLPEEQQEVVRMRIRDEKTFAEIAELTGAPLGTVLSRMHAALKRLRKELGETE